MKAIGVFPRTKDVRVVDVPEPQMTGSGSVRIRMLEVGVCGTDKEIMRFEYGDPPPGSDFLILGHESLGEVVETTPGVSSVRSGDLAVVTVRRPCPHPECMACRNGQQDFCYTGDFQERGIKQIGGFMTEQVVENEAFIVAVPKELRDIAVLTEPLTIAEKAFQQVLDIQRRLPWTSPAAGSEPPLSGRKGVVLGAGPVGILGAMKLVLAGCEITVYSLEPAGGEKARIVESFGAKYISSADLPASGLSEATGGIDVVYEATGAARLAFDVLQELGANAIFVFTGVPGRKYPVEVDTGLVMRKMVLQNQVVFGTVNAGKNDFAAAIRDLRLFREQFPNTMHQMISRRISMEDLPKLDWKHTSGIKTVVEMQARRRA
jgi:threonine dehydrogenase-like Zn-dependent dehydrogenase